MKHTAGKWKFRAVQKDGRTIALHLETNDPNVVHADPVILSVRDDWMGWLLSSPRGQADKNLIESAPDLLEALEFFVEFSGAKKCLPDKTIQKHLDALAKAKGVSK